MQPKKLIIATDWYWPQKGGVEMFAQTLASNLQSDFNIEIITHGTCSSPYLYNRFSNAKPGHLVDPNGNKISHLRAGIIEKILLLPLLLWNFPHFKKNRIYDLFYFAYRSAFRKTISCLIADAQIIHCISTGYLARCISGICREKKIRLINSPFIHFGKWGDSPGQINAYKASDVLVCPTESFKAKYLSVAGFTSKSNTVVIPPIIPPPCTRSTPRKNDNKFILFLGRREKHKGLPLLLSAYEGLQSMARLIIAGPGKKISSPPPGVTDHGEVDEIEKQNLLNNCTLFCVPSHNESFGMVYVEAMSHGKPVIALDIAPVNEIIENGKSGILVAPYDKEGLRQALKRILNEDNLRNAMGKNAKTDFATRFSNHKLVQQYRNLYDLNKPENSGHLES